MKITDVEGIVLALPDVDASRCDGTQDTLLVRVQTDEGLVGVGEVDSSPLVCKAVIDAPPSHSILTGLRSLLVGENPIEIARLWSKMIQGTNYLGPGGSALHAISGVDQALWDILGQATGRSVVDLLGGAHFPVLRAYASAIMPETPAEAAVLAEHYARQGYRAMKFGWGPIGRDARLDEDLVRAIRTAVGDEIDIMIDAGQVWNLKSALRMAEIFERYGVAWLEEPLHPEDLDGYRHLSERTTIPIAGGERESEVRAFARLIDEARLDIVQPDLGRCGGFTGAKQIVQHAQEQHRRLVPHAFKSGVLLTVSAHLAAAFSIGGMIEYTVSTSPIARDLAITPLVFADGYVTITGEPSGLGVELDGEVLQRFRVA
jgi:L-rhamnonate dehydratase